jgi:hypothetical protein
MAGASRAWAGPALRAPRCRWRTSTPAHRCATRTRPPAAAGRARSPLWRTPPAAAAARHRRHPRPHTSCGGRCRPRSRCAGPPLPSCAPWALLGQALTQRSAARASGTQRASRSAAEATACACQLALRMQCHGCRSSPARVPNTRCRQSVLVVTGNAPGADAGCCGEVRRRVSHTAAPHSAPCAATSVCCSQDMPDTTQPHQPGNFCKACCNSSLRLRPSSTTRSK